MHVSIYVLNISHSLVRHLILAHIQKSTSTKYKSPKRYLLIFSRVFFMLWVRYLSRSPCHMNALGSDEIFMSVTMWHILEPTKSSFAN